MVGLRVLGQVEVEADGTAINVGGPTQRRLLTALAVNVNNVVLTPELVEAVWNGTPPEGVDRGFKAYIGRLRSSLADGGAPGLITTHPSGYALEIDQSSIDASTFEALVEQARAATEMGEPQRALGLLEDALGLWRGAAFGEFANEPWAEAAAARLQEMEAVAQERRLEAFLALGRTDELLPEVEALIAERPYRDGLRACQMLALYVDGRQVEALRRYQEYRELLATEIGIEPGPELVELDQRILAQDDQLLIREPATRSVRDYELGERIGEGAFSVVFRGTQPSVGREVAVKQIRAELANRPEFVRRFEAEAHMVACIEHPHVVPLYDYWREPGSAYLVMRWLRGGTLEEAVLDHPLDTDDVVAMVGQVGAALETAHRAGVVHRDVKSANIFLDGAGNYFLGDFGIAVERAVAHDPESLLSVGSPAYASPEQLRREPASAASDIHSLGIVTYEALTGQLPFPDERTQAGLLERQLNDPIPSVRQVRPELPAGIEGVLAKATAKDPSHRYADVSTFIKEFAEALAPSAKQRAVSRATATLIDAAPNPYKGLRAFQEGDADDFFGRDRLVDRLLAQLDLDGPEGRFVAAVGPSGSGKSSLVRAGLLPRLRAGAVGASGSWFTTAMIPGEDPFGELEAAISRVAVAPTVGLVEAMESDVKGISRVVRSVLPDEDSELLLVIDQFEELFTMVEDEETRSRFLDGLTAAATGPRSRLRVVVTIRADFWDRPLRYPKLARILEQSAVTVTPLAPDELERAIVDPAHRAGVQLESGLVSVIIAEVQDQPGALPLLQYLLTELYERRESGLMRVEHHRELGGVSGALAQRADESYQAFDPTEQDGTRRLFTRLVTPGEGTEDTRRRAHRSELAHIPATVIDAYGAARLLTFDRDPATREPTVEVAHEALIQRWPRLRVWVDEDREGLRIHRHLTASADAWNHRGRDEGDLYRGVRLGAAEEWVAATAPVLTAEESEFLDASVGRRIQDEEAERRRVLRLRTLVAAMAVVAVIALIAGGVAFSQQRRADDQAALADESAAAAATNAQLADDRAIEAEEAQARGDIERLRATAQVTADENPVLAALLAVEAHRADLSLDSLDALHRVLTAVPGFRGAAPGGPYVAGDLLDDGVTLVAASESAIDVWDLQTRTIVRSMPHSGSADDVGVSATGDGSVIAVRVGPQRTMVIDALAGEELMVVDHGTPVDDVQVSPDGESLAAARTDGFAEIWSVATGDLSALLDTGEAGVAFARWDPSAERLALVSTDAGVQFWDVASGEQLWAERPFDGQLQTGPRPFGTLFSTDGARLIVQAGVQQQILIGLDTESGSVVAEPAQFSNNSGFPLDALYWADEAEGVIGVPSASGLEYVDLDDGTQTGVLGSVNTQPAVAAVYSDELDRFVRLTRPREGLEFWSIDRSGPLERVYPLSAEQIEAVAGGGASISTSLSPDGSRLVISVLAFPAFPSTITYDLEEPEPVMEPYELPQAIVVGFGAYTLAVTLPGGVQLLDPDHEPLGPPVPVPPDITDVAASPDGRFFALGRLNGTIELYSAGGELLAALPMSDTAETGQLLPGPVFSNDGEWLGANDALNDTEALWSTDTLESIDIPVAGGGRLVGDWYMHFEGQGTMQPLDPASFEVVGVPLLGDGVAYPTVDGDNALFASAVAGELVRVWDVASGRPLGADLPFAPLRIYFTEDGSILAVPTEDRVTLWNYDTNTWADIACEVAGRNMTAEEWQEFGPRTIDRRATCEQYPLT